MNIFALVILLAILVDYSVHLLADLLNLKKISKLGAPIASIGGAGTFDGIFLTGIFAVVLAAFLT